MNCVRVGLKMTESPPRAGAPKVTYLVKELW